jgi:hypothetical protein
VERSETFASQLRDTWMRISDKFARIVLDKDLTKIAANTERKNFLNKANFFEKKNSNSHQFFWIGDILHKKHCRPPIFPAVFFVATSEVVRCEMVQIFHSNVIEKEHHKHYRRKSRITQKIKLNVVDFSLILLPDQIHTN